MDDRHRFYQICSVLHWWYYTDESSWDTWNSAREVLANPASWEDFKKVMQDLYPIHKGAHAPMPLCASLSLPAAYVKTRIQLAWVQHRMNAKKWKSEVSDITYTNCHWVHEFHCMNKGCKYKCQHFLNMDLTSTGNMIKHVKSCWGEGPWTAASGYGNIPEAHKHVIKPFLQQGTITAMFQCIGKGKLTFLTIQLTPTQTRYEHSPSIPCVSWNLIRAVIVRWVSESVHLFKIVANCGFQTLMKTGHPEYYIPSPMTISHDIHLVFARCREWIGKILTVSEDSWNETCTSLKKLNRSMMGSLALQSTHGPHQTIMCMLLWLYICSWIAGLYPWYWMLWSYQRYVQSNIPSGALLNGLLP